MYSWLEDATSYVPWLVGGILLGKLILWFWDWSHSPEE